MPAHRFDPSNLIPESCIIDQGVQIGKDNTFGPYSIIRGDVEIGDGNWIGPHVLIGGPAQLSNKKVELHADRRKHGITIGNRNVIREHSSIDHPSVSRTTITDDCYIMEGCYVSHDSILEPGCILSAGTKLGGFALIGERANLGLATLVHQFSSIGAFSMIGMGSVVIRDIPPFCKVVGNPQRIIGINRIGMERNGFSDQEISEVERFINGEDIELSARLRSYFDAVARRTAENERRSLLQR